MESENIATSKSRLSENLLNMDSFCDNCGHYKQKHCQIQCPFNIIIEERSVKEVDSKSIEVEENDVITEFFEIKNLPDYAFSIKIRKIKNEHNIEILTNNRILVKPQSKTSVTFKFLEPNNFNTCFLAKLFLFEY